MAEKFSLTAQLHLQAPKNVKQVFNQIQGQLKGASVDVEVKQGAKAVKDLNKVASATKKVQQESGLAARSADKMGKAFGSALKNVLRYDLARRVFSAFTNTLEQGTKDAIQFEREMIKIAQVSGQTMKQLKGLQNTVTQLATSLGVSSSSLVKTGLILKQTGLSVKDTELAMKALAKTELAPTFDNITDTAETAVAAMRQFGIEASRLEGLLSKINTVAANFAVESSDIGAAIKRTGGAFKAAGGQVEELIALFTSVRGTTRETAETIATGFRTIFTRLQRPTTIKFLRQFGIELTDLQGKFVGPFEAVKRLNSALQGLDSTDLRFSAIVEQLGGFRQVSKVIPLIQQFGTAQLALNAQLEGSDSLAKDAATAQASLAVQMQKVTEDVKEMFRTMVSSDAFQALAKMAISLANAITQIGKALAPVLPILGAFVAARAAAWAGGKLMGGGPRGLNKALGTASGDASDVFRGNRGGRVRRFSRGGWVPGSGNGDTVPAMLEPGEFVLRKSAAQAFGPQLNGINKMSKGGGVNAGDFSQIGLQKRVIRNRRVGGLYKKANVAMDNNVQFNSDDNFSLSGFERVPLTVTKEAGQKKGDPPVYRMTGRRALRGNARAAAKSYLASKTGDNWENLLEKTGYMTGGAGLAGNSPFDGMDGNAYVEARSRQAKTTEKTVTEKGVQQAIQGELPVSHLTSKRNKMRLPIHAKLMEDVGKQVKLASGGMVPSLLTPGEFVVNKKSAQSIGYGKLQSMNKYAKGGSVGVQKFIGGGGVMGSSAMGGMMNLAFLKSFKDGTVSATKGLYEAGEGAVWAYSKFQFMGAAVNAVGTQFGLGGEKLDAFTGLMGQTLGIVSAFNVVMNAAVVNKGLEQAGSAIGNFGDIVSTFGGRFKGGGKIGRAIGGKFGKIGENISAKSFGMFAGKETAAKKALQASRAPLEALKKANIDKRAARVAMNAAKAGKGGVSSSAFKSARALLGQRTAVAKKAAQAALKSKDAMRASAKAAKGAAKMFKALNVAGFVATYAIGKWGDAIKNDAMQKFKDGQISERELKSKAGTGGAISGAATGAAIGMIFGPWGMALGAGIGAIYGWTQAVEQAEIAIRRVKFEAAVQDMANSMKRFTDGEIRATDALSQVVDTLSQVQVNAGGVSLAESAKANAQIAKNAQILVGAMGKSAKSVRMFDAEMQGTAKTLVEQGFIQQEHVEQIREEISARIESQRKLQEYTDAQEQAIKELVKLRNIGVIFDEVGKRMQSSSSKIAGIASPTGSVGFGGGLSSLISTRTRDKESIDKFNNAVDLFKNVAGEREGAGLSGFSERVKDIGFLERNLESVLTRVSNLGVLGDDAKAEIRSRLGAAGRGEERGGDDLGLRDKKTSSEISKILNSLEPDDLADIKGNMDSILGKFLDAQKEFTDQYEKGAAVLDKHMAELAQYYEQQRKLELDYISQQQSLSQARFDAETRFIDNLSTDQFSGRSNASVQRQFNDRQRIALSGAGGVVGGLNFGDLTGDVDAIGKAFQEVSQKLLKSRDELASISQQGVDLADRQSLTEGTKDLIDTNSALQTQYSSLLGVLKNYQNTQQRLVVLNKQLNQERSRQKSLKQLFIDMRFGTAEEKESATQRANALMTAFNAQDIDMLKPEMQKQVVAMIQQGLLGKAGFDLLNKEIGENLPSHLAKALTQPNEKTKGLAREIKAIENAGITAGEHIATATAAQAAAIKTAITSANDKFIGDLRNLMNLDADKQLENDAANTLAQIKAMEAMLKTVETLQKQFPGRFQTDTPQQQDRTNKQISWLLANSAEMQGKQDRALEAQGITEKKVTADSDMYAVTNMRKAYDQNVSQLVESLKKHGGSLDMVMDNISQFHGNIQAGTSSALITTGSMRYQNARRSDFSHLYKTSPEYTEKANKTRTLNEPSHVDMKRTYQRALMDMFTLEGGVTQKGESQASVQARRQIITDALDENFLGNNRDLSSGASSKARDAWFGRNSQAQATASMTSANAGMAQGGIIGTARQNFGALFNEYTYSVDEQGRVQRKVVENSNTFNDMIARIIRDVTETGGDAGDLFAALTNEIAKAQERLQQQAQAMRTRAFEEGLTSDQSRLFNQAIGGAERGHLQETFGEDGGGIEGLQNKLKSTIDKYNSLISERNKLGVTKNTPMYVQEVSAMGGAGGAKEAQGKFQWEGGGQSMLDVMRGRPADPKQTTVAGTKYVVTPAGLVPLESIQKAQERATAGEEAAGIKEQKRITQESLEERKRRAALKNPKRTTSESSMNVPGVGQIPVTSTIHHTPGDAPSAESFLPKNQEKSNEAAIEAHKKMTTKSAGSSIYCHDHNTHALLEKLIQTVGGGTGGGTDALAAMRATGHQGGVPGQEEGAGNVGGFGETVQMFSKSVEQLQTIMSGALDINVGGTIKMNVNLNGAEWFQDASDSLMLLAGKQVTDGINNFIKHGLKDARVKTTVDWVSDQSTNVPMAGNNSGGATV